MFFVKKGRGGREVNMINTLSKINSSKIGWEGGGSTSIWIMSVNILGSTKFLGPTKRNYMTLRKRGGHFRADHAF